MSKLRRFQFGLRTLLLLTTGCAALFAQFRWMLADSPPSPLMFLGTVGLIVGVGAGLGHCKGRLVSGVVWTLVLGPYGWIVILFLRNRRATPAVTEDYRRFLLRCECGAVAAVLGLIVAPIWLSLAGIIAEWLFWVSFGSFCVLFVLAAAWVKRHRIDTGNS